MASVGNQEIISQGGKAVDNLASDILAKYGLARKSIHVYGYDRTIAVLRAKNISKGDLERLETFQPFLCEQKISSTIKPLKEAHNKLLDSVWRNTRVDTHFLERIHSGESPAGYVIDFTQPITQYREVLDELALGLERYKYIRNSSDKYANLDLGEQDQGEVVSILQSPYIEHVLQRFTYYYSRIGTKDIAQADLLCLKGKYEIV
jgi:hypothetical protein